MPGLWSRSSGGRDHPARTRSETTGGGFVHASLGSSENEAIRGGAAVEMAIILPLFISVHFSGVGWQANRVQSMKLVQVRSYQSGQLVAIDQTVREVDLGM